MRYSKCKGEASFWWLKDGCRKRTNNLQILLNSLGSMKANIYKLSLQTTMPDTDFEDSSLQWTHAGPVSALFAAASSPRAPAPAPKDAAPPCCARPRARPAAAARPWPSASRGADRTELGTNKSIPSKRKRRKWLERIVLSPDEYTLGDELNCAILEVILHFLGQHCAENSEPNSSKLATQKHIT